MKAADKTIEFCKAWIENKQTKSQHMHYYIVKMPHAEFMMKLNEQPDLVAIKDSFGHVFIPDETLARHHFSSEPVSRNPFFALIQSNYLFNYSLLVEEPLKCHDSISKWQTLDHKAIVHQKGNIINISLIRLGDDTYITDPVSQKDDSGNISLVDWANFKDVSIADLSRRTVENKLQPYTTLIKVPGKLSKISDYRGVYLDYAEDMKEKSWVNSKWIIIPSSKTTLPEMLNENIYEILKSRPKSSLYGISSNLLKLESLRYHFPFNPERDKIFNEDVFYEYNDFQYSGEAWASWLANHFDSELAGNLIRFINDDDEWLKQNAHVVMPLILGEKICAALGINLNGYALLMEETNPSVLSTHVLYLKGQVLTNSYGRLKASNRLGTFTKFLMTPNPDCLTIERLINVCE